MLFVGILAFLFDVVFLLSYISILPFESISGFSTFELVITGLWILFWFAASTAVAVLGLGASAAFGYFSFASWIGSGFLAWRQLKR